MLSEYGVISRDALQSQQSASSLADAFGESLARQGSMASQNMSFKKTFSSISNSSPSPVKTERPANYTSSTPPVNFNSADQTRSFTPANAPRNSSLYVDERPDSVLSFLGPRTEVALYTFLVLGAIAAIAAIPAYMPGEEGGQPPVSAPG